MSRYADDGRSSLRCHSILVLLLALGSGAGLAGRLGAAGRPLEIALRVEEPAGSARTAGGVTSGIPIPRGTLRPGAAFRLLDGDREIPLQTTPLVVDREGWLRWILLDFALDIGSREEKRLVLRCDGSRADAVKPAAPLEAISLEEGADRVLVDTGPLRLRLERGKAFSLLDAVEVEGTLAATGGDVDLVDAETGRRLVAGAPETVLLEYRGPLRVTLRIEGAYVPEEPSRGPPGGGSAERSGSRELPSGLRYITRITARAGSAAVRIEHILANTDSRRVTHRNLRRASLSLRHALGPQAQAAVGVAGQGGAEVVGADLSGGRTVWVHQGKVNRYYGAPIPDAGRAGVGDETRWAGSDPDGWVSVRAGDRGIFLCDRDFPGDPPRRIEADERELRLDYVARKLTGGQGVPFESDDLWLYDLSHRVADVWIDFAPRESAEEAARAVRGRLMAFADPEHYSLCDVLAVGRFGTLEDERVAYGLWGWKFGEGQVPRLAPQPFAFVRWEDNHYESEADSAEALLLMALRTGERGFFDLGEAWARYHANLHAWRTDGWTYDDGAIWFPQGGPLGTRPLRAPAERDCEKWGKGTGDDKELWHLVQAKSCYCHFYGAGLIDHFLLTGSRDSLEAAVDLAEQKDSEFRKHRQLAEGRSTIDDTRGFGRGFYVVVHLLEALPDDRRIAALARLCRDVLWNAPNLDERGFAPSHIGTGFGGFDPKRDLPPEMRAFMERESISLDEKGWLSDREGRRWPVVCLGGTWQHAYVQAAAYRYHEVTGDEDMGDFAYGFGRFAAKHLLSEKCMQTHYYAYMDVPRKGEAWDPWKFLPEHIATQDGEGCTHSGWYTRFFPDAIAIAYRLSGETDLLERSRTFWHYGSKRRYETKALACEADAVLDFAGHQPPKDDSVLSTSRMFREWAHPRTDRAPPEPIRDLAVRLQAAGEAEVRFTAPADRGGGRVAGYQLKWADLPIVSYDEYDFARDDGVRRNFWRARNVEGEPEPSAPGTLETFRVAGLPDAGPIHLVVVSRDDAGNRSALSNVVCGD